MGFAWTAEDMPVLDNPNVIDRVGHFVHARQGQGFSFDMPVMGYEALYYVPEFVEMVRKETGLEDLVTLVNEVRRGAFIKDGDDGWELSFQARALIRNELDPQNHRPIGDTDYATDLQYTHTVLYSEREDGLALFEAFARENGILEGL